MFAVDSDKAVPKGARWKHRQRDERALLAGKPRDEFRAGVFAYVELEAAGHAVENLARRIDVDEVEIDPLDRYGAGVERQHPIIKAACERQLDLGHLPPVLPFAERARSWLVYPDHASTHRRQRRPTAHPNYK